MSKTYQKIVPDTSVIVDGRITAMLDKFSGKKVEIIIPEVIVSELEHQANLGKETGFNGLNELNKLRELAEKSTGKIKLKFLDQKNGKADKIIRETAEENKATLITSDKVQSLVSELKGVKTEYIAPEVKLIEPRIFNLFKDDISSVHIKEGTEIVAKRGEVGNFKLVKISSKKIFKEEVKAYVQEIVECAHSSPQGYIALERRGAVILQIENYRIVITKSPFSAGTEITAVKPLVQTELNDYEISKKLLERLEKRAEGIFVAGPPGHGKTTFAAALAKFYLAKNKVVKTIEHPRDMQLPPEITQYGPLEGSMEKITDILLLVRPDYTIFDEVRKTSDFKVFADLRLSGVGMVGVTHANKAIDSIQRFIQRIELGMIPHIIDTIIFIHRGKVRDVYELSMTVKVPFGMQELDLSRPVIEVRDFETKKLKYELYSYGEEVVVIPISERKQGKKDIFLEIPKVAFTKRQVVLRSKKFRDGRVTILVNGKEVFSSRINRAGNIKIKRNSEQGGILLSAIRENKEITLRTS